jgi:hypothetical protein
MARSTYIYVVLEKPLDDLVATFTVKRELVTWLESQREHHDFPDWVVERMLDGPPRMPLSRDMGTAEHFLEDNRAH